jgi:hypothetical protein
MPQCLVCHGLRLDEDYTQATPFASIVVEAQNGCTSCSMLRKLLDRCLLNYPNFKPDEIVWQIPDGTGLVFNVWEEETDDLADAPEFTISFDGDSTQLLLSSLYFIRRCLEFVHAK